MSPEEIAADGKTLEYDEQLRGLEGQENFHINHLTVHWAEPLAPGEETTLTLRYAGQLIGYPEAGMLYVRETLDPDFTILRYETFCYPQVTLPVAEAAVAARRLDLFDYRIEVTVPESHVVVTGGRPTGIEREDGMATYSFHSYEPDGILMIPIAPYGTVAKGPHRIFHFPESASGAQVLMGKLERVMALFESWFGPARLERGLTIAEIPRFFGSQAGPLILQTSSAFKDPERYHEFYHELSHLWNPQDTDPQPCRWNEGLATFLQGLVEDRITRPGFLDEHLSDTYSRLKDRLEQKEEIAKVAPIDYGKMDITGYSYSTGALFFGLLYDRFGEEALLAFLGDYFQEHRDSGSTDRGLAAALASGLGEDSSALVDEWFLTAAFAERVLSHESWEDLKNSYR